MTRNVKRCHGVVLGLLVLSCGAAPLGAEEQSGVHPYVDQKFFVDLGMYFPDREVKLTVNGSVVGPGNEIDFEERLGLKKSDETFSLNFAWRFGKKWQLETQYFASSGKTQSVLDEDVEWNDIIFGAGTSVAVG